VADLQVSLALLLENEAELARALEAAGGKVGRDFGNRLSGEAKKAFEDLVAQAEKAAKEVGVQFSRQDLRFRDQQGKFLSDDAIRQLQQANKGFDDAVQGLGRLRSALGEISREGTRSMNLLEAAVTGVAVSLTSKLTDAAGSALGSVKGLVQGFLELDGELRLAAAAAGEAGGYQRLSQIVDKVGIDAAGTTKQVAELATSLVRAGFSVSEVEGALAGVVRGAEATGTGFESFGNIVGNTLRGFGLEVDQTARVVDVLVNTANSSNASIEGLGYTFEYTAPIAKALGVSLEDVAAAAGLMANAGIQGSVAGTGLRTGLQKLQQAAGGATPEVLGLVRGQERLQKVMSQLGTTVTDSSGKLLPLEQVFLRLKSGLEKLNQADQVQLANVLFGDEAGSKFLAVTNQSNSAITKMFSDLRNSKGATDTARYAMVGMGLELQQLTGTMDSLRNNIGGVMAAGLRPLVQAANAAVGAVSALPKPVKDTGAALIALGIASTGAAISLTALNLVLAQTGGLAGLAVAARAAGVAVAGIGGNLAIVAAAAAGIALLTGRFGEMDATTKTLVQTTVALGSAVLAFRVAQGLIQLATAAAALYNAELTKTAILTALASGAAKGGWVGALISVAVAGGTAALAYKLIGDNAKVAGQDTEALSSKARELKEQIAQLQKEIANGKKLGIDTTDAQKRVNELYMKLREIERPLEIKLSIDKQKGELKSLKDEYDKLGENDSGRITLKPKIDGAERYLKLLQQIDQGQKVTDVSPVAQQGAKDLAEIEKRVNELLARKIRLPVGAPEQKQIDGWLDIYQRQIDLRKTGIKVAIDREEAQRQLNGIQGDIAAALSKGADPSKLRSQLLPLQIQIRNLDIEREKINKDLAATLEQQVTKDGKRVLTAKQELEVAKGRLSVEQARASLADKIAGQDTARLRVIQQVADAYVNLASAQAALTQSGFDVERNRNSNRLSLAEKELQFLRERGAGARVIQDAEQRIAAIKRDGEQIEYRAMQASIEATAQRFEMERRVLELKQGAQFLEQQGAIRAADQNVLQQRQQLLELRGKLLDPNTDPIEKASLKERIGLQQQSVNLSKQQAAEERTRLGQMAEIWGLERQTQQAQQGTAANQQRAAAAGKGWEDSLSGSLAKLDKAAVGVDRLREVFVGTIQAGNGPVEKIYAAASGLPEPLQNATDATKQLSDGFAAANKQAETLLQTVSRLAKAPAARWAGGGVEPEGTYQVNELGPESFLSRSGALSLIHAPAYGSWSPPSPGMVLPAGLTARLQAMGALGGGSAAAPQLAAIAPAFSGSGRDMAALGRLDRSINRLEGTMRTYNPTVTVNLPGNAGLLHTLQGFR
jgi:TP901 family phage tail tape measure protein